MCSGDWNSPDVIREYCDKFLSSTSYIQFVLSLGNAIAIFATVCLPLNLHLAIEFGAIFIYVEINDQYFYNRSPDRSCKTFA